MKFIRIQLTVFIILFIAQSLIEQAAYEFTSIFNSNIKFVSIESFKTISWSIIYRIKSLAAPYLILIILIFNLIKSVEIYFTVGLLNIIVNLMIMTYFTFFIEHILLDKRIFYFSFISSIVVHFLIVYIKPKILEKLY